MSKLTMSTSVQMRESWTCQERCHLDILNLFFIPHVQSDTLLTSLSTVWVKTGTDFFLIMGNSSEKLCEFIGN